MLPVSGMLRSVYIGKATRRCPCRELTGVEVYVSPPLLAHSEEKGGKFKRGTFVNHERTSAPWTVAPG